MTPIDIYRQQGFGNATGFGARPALLIVDFQAAFTDPNHFGGGNILDALENSIGLLGLARECEIPVAHTRLVFADDGSDAGLFCVKAKGLRNLTERAPGSQIVEQVMPLAGELVVRKTQPSAFFATPLASWLRDRKVDTLIVAGCTTSGCVRASVVDSMSHNLRTVVARDGVGDRALAPHTASLFDMEQKYADVLTCTEIAAHLRSMTHS